MGRASVRAEAPRLVWRVSIPLFLAVKDIGCGFSVHEPRFYRVVGGGRFRGVRGRWRSVSRRFSVIALIYEWSRLVVAPTLLHSPNLNDLMVGDCSNKFQCRMWAIVHRFKEDSAIEELHSARFMKFVTTQVASLIHSIISWNSQTIPRVVRKTELGVYCWSPIVKSCLLSASEVAIIAFKNGIDTIILFFYTRETIE